MANVLRGVVLMWLAVGMAAGQIVLSPPPGGGGGGGSLTVEEADGTPTGSATTLQFDQADGFTVTDEGSGVFQVDLGDIAAARMATNWGTAGTSACSTSGGVLYDNGTAIVCDANFKYNGTALSVNPGTGGGIAFGTSLYIQSNTPGNVTLYSTGPGQNGHSFRLDGVEFFRIGGSQTALFQDQTATTGDTLFIVRRGAGESGNVFEVNWGAAALDNVAVSSAGTLVGQTNLGGIKYQLVLADSTFRLASDNHIKFNSTTTLSSGALDTGITRSSAGVMKITDASTGYGSIDAASYNLGGTGAIIYPPSASEPVDCTTSNDGSMYFDTTDQTMCVCANDGADEWQKIQDMTTDCSI